MKEPVILTIYVGPGLSMTDWVCVQRYSYINMIGVGIIYHIVLVYAIVKMGLMFSVYFLHCFFFPFKEVRPNIV